MSHSCNICSYTTTRTTDLAKHNTTKKHVKNITDRLTECEIELALLKKDFAAKIESLEKDLKTKTDALEQLQKRDDVVISGLIEDKKHYRTIVDTTNANTSQSIGALAFLTTNRNDAPPLCELNNKTAKKCIGFSNIAEFIDKCIMYQKKNILKRFIGDIIVNCYKKENPADQSIWNSDVSRLTFVIRDVVKKKNVWTSDKKGVKVSKYIIMPILSFLKDLLKKYIEDARANAVKRIDKNQAKYMEMSNNESTAGKIISIISSGKLAGSISSYIAKYFQLEKKMLTYKLSDDNISALSDDDNKIINSNCDSSSDDSNNINNSDCYSSSQYSSDSSSDDDSIPPVKKYARKKC